MTDKAVRVTLEGKVVHQCDTVTEAEEWLVDDPSTDKDRVASGDYQISANEAALREYARVAEGSDTETPEADPVNDFDLMRGVLANLLEAVQSSDACSSTKVADAAEAAEIVLSDIAASDRHPFLQTFDEVVSQGRRNLIEAVSNDTVDQGISFEDLTGEMKSPNTDERGSKMRRPMRTEDTLRLLRNRARNVTHGLGIAPLHFAVPGMTKLLEELEEAVMVPSLSDYPDTDLAIMLPHASTYDEWKHGARYVHKKDVDAAWAKRQADMKESA